MFSATDEGELAAIAARCIGSTDALTEAERRLIQDNAAAPAGRRISSADLDHLREAIRVGYDPLGVDLIRLRSPEARRAVGAVYTPAAIVEAMIEWAAQEPGEPPARIVDAGTGSGRFLIAAAKTFPNARLIGVEIDPLPCLLLRANAAVAGFTDRLEIHIGPYRTLDLRSIDGRTLFIGNPPYVRHHEIPSADKNWFAETAKRLGLQGSKLAGLHIHFFLRTREIARPGDFGAFITASEWMDVNYGSLLRRLLADGLGGTALHVLDPALQPFDDALVTAAIACFRVGDRPKRFQVRMVSSLDDLKPLSTGELIEWETVANTSRWSTLSRPEVRKPSGVIELGDLFRVHRGQVTGNNAVWIARTETPKVPGRFLFRAITKARELFELRGSDLERDDHLRYVIDLPAEIDRLSDEERRAVQRFLRWAKVRHADKSYIATHRRPWWVVGLREPPPILCTYMGRRPPVFVRNKIRVRHLNIAHGLYPRQPLSDAVLEQVVLYLRCVGTAGGRIYAGGLVKYEPGEVERLHIPDLTNLQDAQA
jgi:adenine-specific DNA-methyltransferase